MLILKNNLPLILSTCSFIFVVIGLCTRFGSFKVSVVKKKEFDKHKINCSENIEKKSENIGKKIDKLQNLVINLHDKQSKKIERMDNKREAAKSKNSEQLMNINSSIGKISGQVEILINERVK